LLPVIPALHHLFLLIFVGLRKSRIRVGGRSLSGAAARISEPVPAATGDFPHWLGMCVEVMLLERRRVKSKAMFERSHAY